MYISPKQFADYLKNSTLSPKEQQMILKVLPTLTSDQIQEMGKVLMGDVQAQEGILEEHEQQRDQLLLKFSIELDQLKSES
jgi:hypothetical protein